MHTCVSKALLPQAVGDEAVATCMVGSRRRQPVSARHGGYHLHCHMFMLISHAAQSS